MNRASKFGGRAREVSLSVGGASGTANLRPDMVELSQVAIDKSLSPTSLMSWCPCLMFLALTSRTTEDMAFLLFHFVL